MDSPHPSSNYRTGDEQASRESLDYGHLTNAQPESDETLLELDINLDDATWEDGEIPYDWKKYAMVISHNSPDEYKNFGNDRVPFALAKRNTIQPTRYLPGSVEDEVTFLQRSTVTDDSQHRLVGRNIRYTRRELPSNSANPKPFWTNSYKFKNPRVTLPIVILDSCYERLRGLFRSALPCPVKSQRDHQTSVSEPQSPSLMESNSQPTNGFNDLKVRLDSSTWKLLEGALDKHKAQDNNWQNYVLLICDGSNERCLSYDEKPLLLFQQLKDTNQNPILKLKHIRDIRSPIAVAQKRQAARKASQLEGGANELVQKHGYEQEHAKKPSDTQASGRQPVSRLPGSVHFPSGTPGGAGGTDGLVAPVENEEIKSQCEIHGTNEIRGRALPVVQVSYAIAIYPHMARNNDEFDVNIGDTFIITSKARARSWWVVQRDPEGTGDVGFDVGNQGWVPSGCLLEINVPVATAITEARTSSSCKSPPLFPACKAPILPMNILTPGFSGIALVDYVKRGEDELDLSKDDELKVVKRFNHWSYAVKQESGDRGWVPSWFIGRADAKLTTPSTSIDTGLGLDNSDLPQASPLPKIVTITWSCLSPTSSS